MGAAPLERRWNSHVAKVMACHPLEVVSLQLFGLVKRPVGLRIAAGVKRPACPGDVHAVFDEVAAGPFDNPRPRTGLSRRGYHQAAPHAHRPTSPSAAFLGVPPPRLFKDLLGYLFGLRSTLAHTRSWRTRTWGAPPTGLPRPGLDPGVRTCRSML